MQERLVAIRQVQVGAEAPVTNGLTAEPGFARLEPHAKQPCAAKEGAHGGTMGSPVFTTAFRRGGNSGSRTRQS